ncbi:unnamed protein product [Chrysoparadoxa australica]
MLSRVEQTSVDAVSARCSLSLLGYIEDDGLVQHFSKPSRKSPLVNRLYYQRNKVLEVIISRFEQSCKTLGEDCCIINLGAGLSPCLLGMGSHVSVVEVDTPAVVEAKRKCLGACPATSIGSCKYSLHAADLGDVAGLDQVVTADRSLPTLLLLECVLAYLTHDKARQLLEWASISFQSAVVLIYNPIGKHDRYTAASLAAFHHQGVDGMEEPLSTAGMLDMLVQSGWLHPNVVDMNEASRLVIPTSDSERVARIEPFDEYASLHAVNSHYCIALASHQQDFDHLLFGLPSDVSEQQRRERAQDMLNVMEARADALKRSFNRAVTIASISPQYEDQVRVIYREGHALFKHPSVRKHLASSLKQDMANITECYSCPDTNFWIARLGEGSRALVLGHVAMHISEKGAELKRMAVSEAARRMSIGRKLLDTLTRAAKARGCHRVYLTTINEPAAGAISFYAANGFGTSKVMHYSMGGEDLEILEMELLL